MFKKRDSVVGTMTRLLAESRRYRGLILSWSKRLASSPKRLSPLWAPSSLVFNGKRGLLP